MNDRKTVLAVIYFLGAFSLVGLLASTYLIRSGAEAASVAIVSGMTGTALGGLVGLLASTRSSPPDPPADPNVVPAPEASPPAQPPYNPAPSLAEVITAHDHPGGTF